MAAVIHILNLKSSTDIGTNPNYDSSIFGQLGHGKMIEIEINSEETNET